MASKALVNIANAYFQSIFLTEEKKEGLIDGTSS